MGEWRSVLLDELVEIKHGFAFDGQYFVDERSPDVLVTPGNFAIGGGFKMDRPKYYRGPVPPEYVLNVGDLIVTMTDLSKEADTLGYGARVPSVPGVRFLHNQRIGRVLLKSTRVADEAFLHWVLRTPAYRHEVLGSASGSTVKHTAPSRIAAYRFMLPPLEEQHAIARILGALDDKIELNRRMNETLEAMARALFKSWFVDFDPVRAKQRGETPAGMDAATAALFPSRLVATEHGEIPEGWSVDGIEAIADHRREVVQPSDVPRTTPYLGLEHFSRGRIFVEEVGISEELESQKSRFRRGDILFGKLRPYFKKVALAPFDGITSTDVLVLQPKVDRRGLTLLLAASDGFIDHAVALSDGTRMPRTSWEQLCRYRVPLPNRQVAAHLDAICLPIFEKAEAHRLESTTLTRVRDALLPKLLSGELRVPEAERAVAEVA